LRLTGGVGRSAGGEAQRERGRLGRNGPWAKGGEREREREWAGNGPAEEGEGFSFLFLFSFFLFFLIPFFFYTNIHLCFIGAKKW
jgi:hypothetical protein